jgi:hypothetical protein
MQMFPTPRRLLAAGALSMCLAAAAGAAHAASSVDWTRVTPDVIRFDRAAPVTISAAISGGTPTLVQFAAADGTTLLMKDDGIGGDATANDHVYSVQISADLAVGNLLAADVFRKFVGFVDVYEGATRTTRVFVQTQVWTPEIGDVAIVNAGGLTHTSVSLRDALLAVERPFVEVHLSDPSTREPFRQVNFLRDIALGSIVGQGPRGYLLALESIAWGHMAAANAGEGGPEGDQERGASSDPVRQPEARDG